MLFLQIIKIGNAKLLMCFIISLQIKLSVPGLFTVLLGFAKENRKTAHFLLITLRGT